MKKILPFSLYFAWLPGNLKITFLAFILCLALPAELFSSQPPQPNPSNLDEMFIHARDLALNQQGEAARDLCREILVINADYHDASILIARTNAWEQSYDEASDILLGVLQKEPKNHAAIVAMADVKFWSGDYPQAIVYLDKALSSEPANVDLLFLKAQALNHMGDYTPAAIILNQILEIDPTHQSSKNILANIEHNKLQNFIGLGYRGDYFDNQAPWHLYYMEYGRRTSTLGTVIARVNHARRFDQQGLQFEVDAYPTLVEGTYLYLNAGYSADENLFPRFRAGLEVFQMLPSDWEASLGFRLLNFAENDLLILTGSISKYYQQFYFSVRPYITFASVGPGSQSYFLTVRRYFSTPNHHLSVILGTGFSADEDALLAREFYNLESNKVLIQYQQNLSPKFLIKAGAGFQHYSEGIWGNKYTAELGITYLF